MIRYLVLEGHKKITKCAGNAIQNRHLFLGVYSTDSMSLLASALIGV